MHKTTKILSHFHLCESLIKRFLRFLKYEQLRKAANPKRRNDTSFYSYSCLAKHIIMKGPSIVRRTTLRYQHKGRYSLWSSAMWCNLIKTPEDGSNGFLRSVSICQFTCCHAPEFHNLNTHNRDNHIRVFHKKWSPFSRYEGIWASDDKDQLILTPSISGK